MVEAGLTFLTAKKFFLMTTESTAHTSTTVAGAIETQNHPSRGPTDDEEETHRNQQAPGMILAYAPQEAEETVVDDDDVALNLMRSTTSATGRHEHDSEHGLCWSGHNLRGALASGLPIREVEIVDAFYLSWKMNHQRQHGSANDRQWSSCRFNVMAVSETEMATLVLQWPRQRKFPMQSRRPLSLQNSTDQRQRGNGSWESSLVQAHPFQSRSTAVPLRPVSR